jgi:methyl-accepting chemotaxis protein
VGSLPDLIAKEREALLSQLMQELDDRRGTISSLSGELRSTLEAGTETVNSLHTTLETFERIAARYPPNKRASGTIEDSQPFDITEFTQMVREFTVATRELNALAQQVDTALPAVSTVTQEVAGRVERIQNYLFMQILAIVVVTVSAILVAAITYRVAVIRFNRPKVQP